MFNRARLLREYPWDAQSLAEELYAMFDPEIPINHEGPLTLTARNGVPPLIINNLPTTTFPITQNPPAQQIPNDPDQPIVVPDLPSNTLKRQEIIDVINSLGLGGGANCFPGIVTGGAEGEYSVDVYFDGLSEAATSVTVGQLQIAAGEAIPAGTWALVIRVLVRDESTGELYYLYFMQVPVWLS